MPTGTESERHKQLKNFAIALARASGWQPEEIQEEYTYGGARWDVAVVPNNITFLRSPGGKEYADIGRPVITFEAGNLNITARRAHTRPRGKARHWYDDEGILCLHLPYSLDVPEISEPKEHEYIERLEPTIFRLHDTLDWLDAIGSNFPYPAKYGTSFSYKDPGKVWSNLADLEAELLKLIERVQKTRLLFGEVVGQPVISVDSDGHREIIKS